MNFGEIVLVVAVAAPLAGLIPAVGFVQTAEPARWSQVGALAAAASWAVLLVADQHPRVGSLEPQALGLSVGVASGLLVFNLPRPSVRVGLGLSAITTGFVATVGDRPSNGYLAAALIAAFLCGLPRLSAASPRRPDLPTRVAAAAALGVVLCSVGVVREAAPLLAAGAVLVVATTAARPYQPYVVVLPGVLGAGLRLLSDTGLPNAGERVPLALGLAAAATLAVVAAARLLAHRDVAARQRHVPAVLITAVVLWALAASARPVVDAVPAALLLAAGAVLALPLGGWVPAVTGLPGAVTLAQAFADAGGATAAALGGLLLATSVGAARLVVAADGLLLKEAPERPVTGPTSFARLGGVGRALGEVAARFSPAQAVAAGFCLWLVVAPRTWGWAVPGGELGAPLGPYQDGVLAAAAAGGVVTVLVLVGRWRRRGSLLAASLHPDRLPG